MTIGASGTSRPALPGWRLLVIDDDPARVEVNDIEAFRGVGHRAVAGRGHQHPQRIQTIGVVRFDQIAGRGALDAFFQPSDKTPQDLRLG